MPASSLLIARSELKAAQEDNDLLAKALQTVEDDIEIAIATSSPETLERAEALIHQALVATGFRTQP